MTRMQGSASKDLGRRAYGTAGGSESPGEAPGRSGEMIDVVEAILRKPVVLPLSRAWKPQAGRIYNFPLRTVPDEK
jgi:hypothetical protein